jgi:hypothetical protein
MRIGYLGVGSALLCSLLTAGSASAQRVQADIRIGGRGPISGHIRIGDRYDWRRDYRPRRIRVEVIRGRDRGRHEGWFRNWRRDARVVVVYYDRRNDWYYDRYRPGLYEARVYHRGGRYVRWDDFDDRYGRNGRYGDRDDDRDDDRYRRDGRSGGRGARDW